MKKNKFLITENIFLDTSIFEEQNFLHSTKIHSLFYYAKVGAIKIHITNISKLELFSRIEKRVSDCNAELKKFTKIFDYQNVRILKNLGFYDKIIIPKLDIENHTDELKRKIESFFANSRVNTIVTESIPVLELVNNYHHKQPPFHNSGKQNEFIDAFILKSLEIWCEKNKTKMYVLSKDPDFLGYKSKYLIFDDKISNLLENISNYFEQKYELDIISRTQKIVENFRLDLEQISTEIISDKITLRSKTVDISSYEIVSNILQSYKIITIRKDLTEVECIFKCKLSFFVFEENDYSESYPKRKSFIITVPMFLEIVNNKIKGIKPLIENPDYIYQE